MLRRSNKRKNQSIERTENKITPEVTPEEPMSREEFIAQNEDARKMFESIVSLRRSVETLKQSDSGTGQEPVSKPAQTKEDVSKTAEQIYLQETDEIIAARQAILDQAKRDAEQQQAKREEAIRREVEARQEQQRVLEAQKRVAMMAEEAEKKRQQAIQAEKQAREVARKKALAEMEAERRARQEQARLQEEAEQQARRVQIEQEAAQAAAAAKAAAEGSHDGKAYASAEEMASFFDDTATAVKQVAELENAKKVLLSAQKEQDSALGMISHAADVNTGKLAEEQQERLTKQQLLIKNEQEKLAEMLENLKSQRLESVERERAERQLRKQKSLVEHLIREQQAHAFRAEKAARAKAEREEREAKARAEREAKKERIKKKREERIRKAEERELIKKAKRDAIARAKLEKKRLEEKSKADAELGGGIVNVQGVTINTEIKETPNVSLRDLIGIKDKQEKKAETEQEKQELREEREKRTEEARAYVDMALKQKAINYQQSAFSKKVNLLKAFCDRHKVALLTAFAVVLMALVGAAGVFNYYTAYAYSYNGKTLGIVKEKDDVLRITDLVQGALTEDKGIDVILDVRDDIEFERVSALGDVKIDTSEDILKRLTYMGNLNVEAYGIYVNGKKAGAVESRDVAREVLREIEDRYTSGMEGAKVEKVEIVEDVKGKKSNTDLDKVFSQAEMVNLLCTSGEKESLHEVVPGETLADIAKLYSMTEEEILADNENVNPKSLDVGSTLVIRQIAPILTVRAVETVTYEEEVPYEAQQTESADIYEGYTELQQQGQNGLSEITSRITLVNGEQIEEDVLVTTVKKKPVAEITLVGTKERPPSVGSGKYIWPLSGGYTKSSGFKYRWGRLHAGIDLATSVGSDVMAADGGVVTFAGYSGAYGYLVKIDHQNGMETRYAHNSKLLVSEGDRVFQGQHIAESGNTGRSTGPHLHFEVRVNGEPKNPENYLP